MMSILRPFLASLAATLALAAPAQAATPIQRWVTAGSRHLAAAPSLGWAPAGRHVPGEIVIEPDHPKQTLLGFGAALTDAACYDLSTLAPAARKGLLEQIYGRDGIGLSVGRVCIGSSDYARNLYSYDEGAADPTLSRFSIAHDESYILPVLRELRVVNPQLYLFGSPWSPPGWMKPNNSMLGGCMERRYMDAYAHYFLKFLQAYAAAGVPVRAVTVQNEVDTDQDGRMPACAWPQEYEMSFAGDFLGPLLAKHDTATQVWLLDHNYSLWGRALDELSDPSVRKVAGAIAWHGYVGSPALMTRVHNAYPHTDMHWTEGGPDITDPGYATNWSYWSGSFAGILQNWCRSITSWNLALDEHGKPDIGPFSCGGLVTIDSKTHAVRTSGQYWALAHYAKFMRPGSTIVTSHSTRADVQYVTARTPDGHLVAVLTNPGKAATRVVLRQGAYSASVALPADSISTLTWKD